jgi:hypothetical protein
MRKSHHHIPAPQQRGRHKHQLAVVKDGSTHPNAQKLVGSIPGHLARAALSVKVALAGRVQAIGRPLQRFGRHPR